ncbi:pyridoxamine 5'-phosphate oxidase family protein [Trinickia sp. YCB016]
MSDPTSRETALEQSAFDEWPPELRALFDGTALAAKVGFTASLVTIDANGHARTSLLSAGELYAPDSRTLCFALWPSSRSARALHERAQAALTFVHDEAFYQVQFDVQPLTNDEDAGEDDKRDVPGSLACFAGSIDTGESQRVRYARLTSGITFDLEEGRDAVLDRWERQIEHLRQAASGAAGR